MDHSIAREEVEEVGSQGYPGAKGAKSGGSQRRKRGLFSPKQTFNK